MICEPCRKAGAFNKESNAITYRSGPDNAIARLTREAHKSCPGGTWCDCQHYVGQALNAERIEGKNAVSE